MTQAEAQHDAVDRHRSGIRKAPRQATTKTTSVQDCVIERVDEHGDDGEAAVEQILQRRVHGDGGHGHQKRQKR